MAVCSYIKLRTLWTIALVLITPTLFSQNFDYPHKSVNTKIRHFDVNWAPTSLKNYNNRAKWNSVNSGFTELKDVQFTELNDQLEFERFEPELIETIETTDWFYKDSSKLNIQYLDIAHGLFDQRAYAVVELKDGRIMIISDEKYGIYNGKHMKVYQFGFSEVFAANLLSDGKVWIASRTGAVYWDNGIIYKLKHLTDKGCWIVKENSEKDLLIGSIDNGFYLKTKDKLKHYKNESALKQIRNFVQDDEGNYWIIGMHGLTKWDGHSWWTYDQFGPHSDVAAIEIYKKVIYLGTWKEGFYKLEADTLFKLESGFEKEYPIFSILKKDNGIWFTVLAKGLVHLDNNGRKLYMDAGYGFSSNSLYSMHLGSYNNFWIGHHIGGMSNFKEDLFRPSFYHTNIKGVIEINKVDSVRFFLSDESDMTRMINGKFEKLVLPDTFGYKRVLSADILNSTDMWIANFGNGIAHYKDEQFINYFEDSQSQFNNAVGYLNLDRNKRVWFNDYYNNVRFLESDTIYVLQHDDNFKKWVNTGTYIDRKRQVYLVFKHGFLIPLKNQLKLIGPEEGILSLNILGTCMNRFGDGAWFLSDKGLQLLDSTSVIRTYEFDHFDNMVSRSIIHVSENRFLLTSNKAIFEITLDGDKAVVQKKGREYGQYILGNNLLRMVDDTVRMITNSSVVDFIEGWNGYVEEVPKVKLLSAKVSGSYKNDHFTMKQDEEVEIEFEVINWAKTETVFYRLNGKKWSQLDNNKLRLSDLSYGDYTLEVYAENEAGKSDILTLNFSVDKKWYQTTLFLVSVFLLLILITISYFLYRIRRQKKNEAKLNKIIDERTRELRLKKERLEIELNKSELLLKEVHHRVKNNMQMVSSVLELQLAKTNVEKSKKILKLASDRIKAIYLSHHHLYLNENYDDLYLKEYLESIVYSVKSGKDIELSISIDDQLKLPIETAQLLGLIFNELYTNSIKHAWPETIDAKPMINLSLIETDQYYTFSFSDNGIGINPDKASEQSIGMLLLKGFAERQLKGHLKFTVNNGTLAEVTFPIPKMDDPA